MQTNHLAPAAPAIPGDHQACCDYHRKRGFSALQQVFGVRNVFKRVRSADHQNPDADHQNREAAVNSLVMEAELCLRDPVNGLCVQFMTASHMNEKYRLQNYALMQQIETLQRELLIQNGVRTLLEETIRAGF